MTDSTSAPGRRPGASELLNVFIEEGEQLKQALKEALTELWGRQVPSRLPGVFVIELPRDLRDAPVDIVAVRRWLERVPAMTLDGDKPTAEEIAKRLHEFWLPDEPILYVGRSAKTINARLSAMYATPLGDARPHSGGHWLRTLSVLSELRVWRQRRTRNTRTPSSAKSRSATPRSAAMLQRARCCRSRTW